MRRDTPRCRSMLLFLLVTIIIACFCGSSVQLTGDDKPYFISRVSGSGDSALKVNVPALEATFGSIFGFAQSSNGDLYATATNNNVVLKLSEFNKEEGTWSNVTVIAGTGSSGRGADDIVGTESALDLPNGLSLIENSSGDVTGLLIAEWNTHRIRKLDMSTQIITTIAGSGTSGFFGDGGSATAAHLKYPRHAYYDNSTGDIYIADAHNSRIRRVREGNITTVVGKQCTGSAKLGDGGQAIDACLISPFYFTVNSAGEWLIADFGDNRIRKVDLNGIIRTVAGGGTITGDAPATQVRLNNPMSIAPLSKGELLVADYSGGVVRKMDNSGFMRVIAGGGDEWPSTRPIRAKTASMMPTVIAYTGDTGDGNDLAIFVGDFYGHIYKLTSSTKCYGVKSDNAAVCSGHGSCTRLDECQCDGGWMGIECSITHCFGFTSNHPDVCSGHGKCVKPGKCRCNEGHKGHYCQR